MRIIPQQPLHPHPTVHGMLCNVPIIMCYRTQGNKWMGLGAPTKRDSLIAESRNMSPLGGAEHARTERWNELELPLPDFMMGARHVLRRSDHVPTMAF